MGLGGVRVEPRILGDVSSLTPREAEVLEGLGRDESNAEIALASGIGVETVRTYVARVLRKLNVPSRLDLVGVPTRSSDELEAGDN